MISFFLDTIINVIKAQFSKLAISFSMQLYNNLKIMIRFWFFGSCLVIFHIIFVVPTISGGKTEGEPLLNLMFYTWECHVKYFMFINTTRGWVDSMVRSNQY